MRRIAVAVLALLLTSILADADPYPSRRITVIAPFGAGSGTDSVARIVSQRLLRQRLADIGFEAKWMASREFARYLAADIELWDKLVREAGIERR